MQSLMFKATYSHTSFAHKQVFNCEEKIICEKLPNNKGWCEGDVKSNIRLCTQNISFLNYRGGIFFFSPFLLWHTLQVCQPIPSGKETLSDQKKAFRKIIKFLLNTLQNFFMSHITPTLQVLLSFLNIKLYPVFIWWPFFLEKSTPYLLKKGNFDFWIGEKLIILVWQDIVSWNFFIDVPSAARVNLQPTEHLKNVSFSF